MYLTGLSELLGDQQLQMHLIPISVLQFHLYHQYGLIANPSI